MSSRREHRASTPILVKSGCITLPGPQCIHQGNPMSLSVQSFYWVSLHKHDGLNHWPHDWTQFPVCSPLWRSGNWRCQPYSGPALILKLPRGLLWVTAQREQRHFYRSGFFKGFWNSVPEPKDQTNSSSIEVKEGFWGRDVIFELSLHMGKNTSVWNHQGMKKKGSFKGLECKYSEWGKREGCKDGHLAVLCRSAFILCKLWGATEDLNFSITSLA